MSFNHYNEINTAIDESIKTYKDNVDTELLEDFNNEYMKVKVKPPRKPSEGKLQV